MKWRTTAADGRTDPMAGGVVPVLLYHCVSDSPPHGLADFSVSPAEFARHMDVVVASSRRCLTVSELVARRASTADGELLERLVLVTFDDGYADFAGSAQPIMAARGITSTLYVTTGWLADAQLRTRRAGPRTAMLSSADLLPLAGNGVEVGAHSHTHPQMDTLSEPAAWSEIVTSRDIVRDALGQDPRSFAYPHGFQSPRLRRQARSAGFTSAVGVRNAFTHARDDLFNVARLTVTSTTSLDTVANWVAGRGATVAPGREHVATVGYRAVRRGKSLVTGRPGSAWTYREAGGS